MQKDRLWRSARTGWWDSPPWVTGVGRDSQPPGPRPGSQDWMPNSTSPASILTPISSLLPSEAPPRTLGHPTAPRTLDHLLPPRTLGHPSAPPEPWVTPVPPRTLGHPIAPQNPGSPCRPPEPWVIPSPHRTYPVAPQNLSHRPPEPWVFLSPSLTLSFRICQERTQEALEVRKTLPDLFSF